MYEGVIIWTIVSGQREIWTGSFRPIGPYPNICNMQALLMMVGLLHNELIKIHQTAMIITLTAPQGPSVNPTKLKVTWLRRTKPSTKIRFVWLHSQAAPHKSTLVIFDYKVSSNNLKKPNLNFFLSLKNLLNISLLKTKSDFQRHYARLDEQSSLVHKSVYLPWYQYFI